MSLNGPHRNSVGQNLPPLFLCLDGAALVQSEKGGGKILGLRNSMWTVQLIMPLGFGVIALRLLWHAADAWRDGWSRLMLAGSMIWIGFHPPTGACQIGGARLGGLAGGGPCWRAHLCHARRRGALILFWGEDIPIASISLTHYSMVTNPTLPTLPLFTLAGYFLAGRPCLQTIDPGFPGLLGQFRGGPASSPSWRARFFSSFTGASGVTILALGGLLLPVLMGAGYSERSTLGILTGSGGLGLLSRRRFTLILFAIVAGIQLHRLGRDH